MTTILHSATYSIIPFLIARKSMSIFRKSVWAVIFAFIGGYPDYAKFFYGESYNDWSGSYRRLHEISWNNWLYFPHTGLDYITHDHIKGGWTWYAVPVECVMWIGIFYMIYRIWRGK